MNIPMARFQFKNDIIFGSQKLCYACGTVPIPTRKPRLPHRSSVLDPKLFFSDPDQTFQEISDPDPTQLLSKEAKANFSNKTEAQVLILKKMY